MDQLQVCNHTLHNDYIWCCPYPSLGGRFKSVPSMFDVSYFHTNRVYSDSLRVTAVTVDNS